MRKRPLGNTLPSNRRSSGICRDTTLRTRTFSEEALATPSPVDCSAIPSQ